MKAYNHNKRREKEGIHEGRNKEEKVYILFKWRASKTFLGVTQSKIGDVC